MWFSHVNVLMNAVFPLIELNAYEIFINQRVLERNLLQIYGYVP